MNKKLAAVAGTIVAAAVVLWWIVWPAPAPRLVITPPANNAFGVFLAAGEQVDAATDRWDEVDEAELAEIVAANADAVAQARAALDRESVVPLDRRANPKTVLQSSLNDINSLNRLGRAMLAAGRLAQLQGETVAARELAVDLLRLSRAISRGGLLVHHLKGLAYQGTAIAELEKLIDSATADETRELQRRLHALAAPVEDPATVVDREIGYFMGQMDIAEQMMHRGIAATQRTQSLQSLSQATDRVAAAAAVLRIRVALHAFRLENGRLPLKLVELVPEYLPELPTDPATGKPFVYELDGQQVADQQPDGAGYQLHRPAATELGAPADDE